jgi:hypothetical protein
VLCGDEGTVVVGVAETDPNGVLSFLTVGSVVGGDDESLDLFSGDDSRGGSGGSVEMDAAERVVSRFLNSSLNQSASEDWGSPGSGWIASSSEK